MQCWHCIPRRLVTPEVRGSFAGIVVAQLPLPPLGEGEVFACVLPLFGHRFAIGTGTLRSGFLNLAVKRPFADTQQARCFLAIVSR